MPPILRLIRSPALHRLERHSEPERMTRRPCSGMPKPPQRVGQPGHADRRRAERLRRPAPVEMISPFFSTDHAAGDEVDLDGSTRLAAR
jgi:hypothetical protein